MPPPLDSRLKFLEDGPSASLSSLFQAALNALGPEHAPSRSDGLGRSGLELDQLVASTAPNHDSSTPTTLRPENGTGSFWGFWDDLLTEADQAAKK